MPTQFNKGDLVQISDDACLNTSTTTRPTHGRGKTGVVQDGPNPDGNYRVISDQGITYLVLPQYLTRIGDPQTPKFKAGDWVKIAEDATFNSSGGAPKPCSLAGLTSQITAGPDKYGDYLFTSDIRATCHRAAHGRFLTPFFECETEVKSAAPSSSKYCICGGPSKPGGFETLVFTICGSCKKEKQP